MKSIALGNAVAVVDEPTAFSSELPDDLILKLPADPCAAGNTLTGAIEHRWAPDAEKKSAWIRSFVEANTSLMERLVEHSHKVSGNYNPRTSDEHLHFNVH